MLEQPKPEEILEELQRILNSVGFRKSQRASDLLRFLVTQLVRGESAVLKETLIGIHVFGKESYDPAAGDSQVRTAATRLRQRLEKYYETEGKQDLWRISLPKEGYVPCFTRRDEEAPPAHSGAEMAPAAVIHGAGAAPSSVAVSLRSQSTSRIRWRYAFALAIVLLGLAGILRAVISLEKQPYVAAYHQLTDDGRTKLEPLFTDGRFVYFLEMIEARGQPSLKLASVPTTGDRDPELYALPGPKPILFDYIGQGKFLLRLDVSKPIGSYSIWEPHSGSLVTLKAKGSWNASVSPDRRLIADARTDQIIISQFPSGTRPYSVRVSSAFSPRWSPDGRRLRFSVRNWPKETNSIWECDRDGSGLHRIVDDRYGLIDSNADWTPDGRLYIFQHHTLAGGDLLAHIEGLALSRQNPVSLTNGPLILRGVRSSRDSSTLYALGEGVRGELVRFDPKIQLATPYLGGISALDLSFSRDGQWVTYQRFPEHTLWKSRVDGTEAIQLTTRGLEAIQPHWSPDGKRIGFMGHRSDGRFLIYVIGADGKGLAPLKPHDELDQGVPTWSADGSQVAFGELRERKPDSEMQIRLIDLATKQESVLPGSKGLWTPRWSPDGKYVVAQTTDFSGLKLYSLESRTWQTLAQNLFEVNDPVWSRDSRFVYFRCFTREMPGREAIARISLGMHKPVIVAESISMIPRQNPWFTITPRNEILLFQSVRTQEVYALDLAWK